MATFDTGGFTELVLKLYSEKVRKLERVRFMLLGRNTIEGAVNSGRFRVAQKMRPEATFLVDDYGRLNEHNLAEAVVGALSEALMGAATKETQPEEHDPLKRIGAGELLIIPPEA